LVDNLLYLDGISNSGNIVFPQYEAIGLQNSIFESIEFIIFAPF